MKYELKFGYWIFDRIRYILVFVDWCQGACWDIRNVFLVSFFPYIIISLYHSFLISFFPILRMVITLYIYFVHEWIKGRMRKNKIKKPRSSIWRWYQSHGTEILDSCRKTDIVLQLGVLVCTFSVFYYFFFHNLIIQLLLNDEFVHQERSQLGVVGSILWSTRQMVVFNDLKQYW